MIILQSTKLQYLEVLGLPDDASMYTLDVNSISAKPVLNDQASNSILVPLLIGLDSEAANEGHSLRTSVELSYVSSHDAMSQNGTLSLSPPHFKLPVSVETVHLQLPKGRYDYNFTGDFSRSRNGKEFAIPAAFAYGQGRRVVEEDYQFSFSDDILAAEDNKRKTESVKMVTANTGSSFYFHRLMVVDSAPELTVSYADRPKTTPQTKSWWLWWKDNIIEKKSI